ncbi:MAG: hypothetical protein HYU99_03205 [Deltaproteobacteria bacterium]|nr:hypothetical protein [Deltaproteobacteria bacterium]
MQKLRIRKGKGFEKSPLAAVYQSGDLTIEADPDVTRLNFPDGRSAFLAGRVIGIRSASGALEGASPGSLQDYISSHSVEECRNVFEGRYLLAVVREGGCETTLDQFAQSDLFIVKSPEGVLLANDLDLLPVRKCGRYNQEAIAHFLTVYGYRPPKQHTFYSGISRLGVGQTARLRGTSLEIGESEFKGTPIGLYGDRELEEYSETLLDAVEKRGSRYGNVVYLSSGWDSTSLLACLVHLFGARKVRAVIGRMNYNERSGIINQFELDRAKKVADYFGVRLDIAEFDYWKKGPEYLEECRGAFRSQHISSITALNHMRLAAKIAQTSDGGESAFVGEISDGAHNLGFSQFVTVFHPDLGFREYADKMASYLYGPTFLGLLEKGTFKNDPIYNLIRSNAKGCEFDEPAGGGSIRRQVLESFFLRNSRIPLFSRRNVKLLTKKGQDHHNETMGVYLARASREATPETLYAWYLHLYNSFHWQGSTVACIDLAGDKYGINVQTPFRDSRLIDFLSAMPEDWGRGLDIRPTKYPLKWMLKNKIDYPLHLQVGPHSYLYDVDPNFNHSAEILYGSSFTSYHKKQLAGRFYERMLDPEIFDMNHINTVTKNYLDGKEATGSERNDLFSLCMLDWASDYLRDVR